MRYRNRKTGNVIEITGKLAGGDWEEVKPPKAPPTRKKTVKKDG